MRKAKQWTRARQRLNVGPWFDDPELFAWCEDATDEPMPEPWYADLREETGVQTDGVVVSTQVVNFDPFGLDSMGLDISLEELERLGYTYDPNDDTLNTDDSTPLHEVVGEIPLHVIFTAHGLTTVDQGEIDVSEPLWGSSEPVEEDEEDEAREVEEPVGEDEEDDDYEDEEPAEEDEARQEHIAEAREFLLRRSDWQMVLEVLAAYPGTARSCMDTLRDAARDPLLSGDRARIFEGTHKDGADDIVFAAFQIGIRLVARNRPQEYMQFWNQVVGDVVEAALRGYVERGSTQEDRELRELQVILRHPKDTFADIMMRDQNELVRMTDAREGAALERLRDAIGGNLYVEAIFAPDAPSLDTWLKDQGYALHTFPNADEIRRRYGYARDLIRLRTNMRARLLKQAQRTRSA